MYRTAVYYFAGLFLLAIAAFWPTYFFPPKYETDWHIHFHGVVMFGWVELLIAQAWLIRAKRNPIHRQLGKVSFVLAPVIVASTLLLAGYRLRESVTVDKLYFLYVQLSLIAVFGLSYGLAIANRRQSPLHMRYMVCTSLTLVDPIVARLLYFNLGIDFPQVQMFTYGLIDAILVALAWHDRKHHPGLRVFPAMLAVFVVSQAPTFFVYQQPVWREFARWYAGLPLP
jgi:uncharacterized membrane protein